VGYVLHPVEGCRRFGKGVALSRKLRQFLEGVTYSSRSFSLPVSLKLGIG
jgi:hypothetical protein